MNTEGSSAKQADFIEEQLRRIQEHELKYDGYAVQKELIELYQANPDIAAQGLLMRNDRPLKLAVHQRIILRGMWDKQFVLLVLTRGGSKTFILALYQILKALLYPREKCISVSATYRQSKLIFDEIARFYQESPLFREACIKSPTKGPDTCECLLSNGSSIIAVPLGDGTFLNSLYFYLELILNRNGK